MKIRRKALFVMIWFLSTSGFCQVSGTVVDEANGLPIPFVNVWVKNSRLGATTGKDGDFEIEGAKPGDSILISSLGFSSIEFAANEENNVSLKPKITKLNEVVLLPMKNSAVFLITSFKKIKKNRIWYNNGFYSLARFFDYKEEYTKTPFLGQISLLTNNAKKENVIFRLRLVAVGHNGEPSENGLTDNIVLEAKKGVTEVISDLTKEKILFPENGFFVVVDRLNIEENKNFNKTAKMDILQPAIGIERTKQEKNTWFGYGGKWIPPLEMKEYLGTNENIAVNIKLTN